MENLTFYRYLSGLFNLNFNKTNDEHTAVLTAIAEIIKVAESDLNLMNDELYILSSTGEWLDEWGSYFNVPREFEESDKIYAKRIIDSISRPKSTIPSIQSNVANEINKVYGTNYTADDIIINEPWKQLGRYSHFGELSNKARFYSKDYWTHGVIEIGTPENPTKSIIDVANEAKAAGIRVYWFNNITYSDIVGGKDVLDTSAFYHRRFNFLLEELSTSGLILSASSDLRQLSGKQIIDFYINTHYEIYCKIEHIKDTDLTQIITKGDLLGLITSYKDTQGDTIKLTDSYIRRSNLIERLNELSLGGNLLEPTETDNSEETKQILKKEADPELRKIVEAIQQFREDNCCYYHSVMPPISKLKEVPWFVDEFTGWIMNSPAVSFSDFLLNNLEEDVTLESLISIEESGVEMESTKRLQPAFYIGQKETSFKIDNYQTLLSHSTISLDEFEVAVKQKLFTEQPFTMSLISPDKELTLENLQTLEDLYLEQGFNLSNVVQSTIEIM